MHLLLDIGGTNLRVAASYNGKTLVAPKIIPTPKQFREGVAIIAHFGKLFSNRKKISNVIIGIAGPLTKEKTGVASLLVSSKLRDWVKKPLQQALQRSLHAPVYIENDASMVGLGEAMYGAGKGKSIVAYITISTGVNGTRIVDGHIDTSSYGFEIGQQIIHDTQHDKSSGMFARLEDNISGTSLIKKYGTHPRHIRKMSVWRDLARYLAYGVNNTIVYWSPDIVVLGGSMMKTPGIPLDLVKKYTRKTTRIFTHLPEIKKATLKDFGGLYGALAYIKEIK